MDFVSSFSMMYCSISHIKEQSSLKSQKYLQKTEKSHKRTVVQGGARGRGQPRGCGRPRGRERPRVARNIQPRGCGRGQGRPWVETAGVMSLVRKLLLSLAQRPVRQKMIMMSRMLTKLLLSIMLVPFDQELLFFGLKSCPRRSRRGWGRSGRGWRDECWWAWDRAGWRKRSSIICKLLHSYNRWFDSESSRKIWVS